ncbi:MAG: hypothetical protein ACPGVU_21650 [Limisphaerales bacterium]
MKKAIFALVGAIVISGFGVGCVSTVDGGKRGTPVWWKKDKLGSRYQMPVQDVFDAAKYVLGSEAGGLGVLISENRINHSLRAKVDTRTVYVRVTEIEPTVTQVLTQIRTSTGNSDLDLVAEIDKQIALRLQVVRSGGR